MKKVNFNIEAANWDSEKRIKRAKIIADEIIKSIPIEGHFRALEFGCGTGLVSFNLADKFEHITLIDTSEGMIDKLNQKIRHSDVKNMNALCRDINAGSKLNEKYDVIYTSMALHHTQDINLTLETLYELLNSEGHLCIIELTPDDGSFHKEEKDFKGYNGFNQDFLKGLLHKLGFKNLSSHIFYNDKKLIDGVGVDYSLFIMTGRK